MAEMSPALRKLYDLSGPLVVQALRKRHFDAYYCNTAQDARRIVPDLIPRSHSVSWGGSETIRTLGIPALLKENGYTLIDRDSAASPEERAALMRQGFSCGTFLMSSNAVTEDGQLFNIDGTGNRLAALLFGPESVVVIAGMNKVVKTLDDAVSRVRNYASPLNMQRFSGLKTPCAKTGQCADCVSTDCICAYMVTTRISRPAGKIKVVLVGEPLGF
ncbi:lactate utilization protein [Treponema brennaborense]|uniref:LUD domain-containing protein n=1 Tax=Treponema brennaborense (strain DSM 12168 / CIP 105900 / DD5/3) TaxID=906968 RepID=F4LKM1_TREBD|nr:lactate utilization protein [Treponema brennaborense]AEE17577.1 protein of unknown function DUF1121 [Treponema brennaborense DSM 12168]